MSSQLDELIDGLKPSPADGDLSQVEARVWRRIDEVRRARRADTWLVPARAAAVAGALGLGAILGVARAETSQDRLEVTVFDIASAYAPSTLLDHQ